MSNKLEVNLEAVNGGQSWAILTGVSPIYQFEDGKRKNDTPTGTKISLALQGNRFSPLTVKIEGNANALPSVTDEQINAACSGVKLLAVKFADCKIALYSIKDQMIMSATATSAELVNFGK